MVANGGRSGFFCAFWACDTAGASSRPGAISTTSAHRTLRRPSNVLVLIDLFSSDPAAAFKPIALTLYESSGRRPALAHGTLAHPCEQARSLEKRPPKLQHLEPRRPEMRGELRF